jgi:hypothetical protein
VLIVAAYIVFAFIAVYFQAALVVGANERLQGRDTTLGGSLAVANSKLDRLLPWALVSATVSIILGELERQGWLGAIIANLLGMAWNVLTFLTIPIIVLENLGPINALKRSGTLFKQTWGENLVAQIGFGFVALIALLPALLIAGLGVASGVGVVIGVTVAIAVAWFAVVTVVIGALSGVYRTALYRYAVDGRVPDAFAATDFSSAFTTRRRRQ